MNIHALRNALATRGFDTVNDLFNSEALDAAEQRLDELFTSADPRVRRWRQEMGYGSDQTPVQPEIVRPSRLDPSLRETAVFLQCQQLASACFDSKAHYLFDHAIYKMPLTDSETAWHQDQAYLGATVQLRSLHFWIPFQDTDTVNGTMRFLDQGSNTLVPHSARENQPHLLQATIEDPGAAHEVPIRRGDASVHTPMTLHSTGANHSGRVRKAWILHFGTRPRWYKHWLQIRSRLQNP